MPATDAAFEAGIKLGAAYHQFIGTPVSPANAASLETAIAEAITNQPFVTDVTVQIDRDRLAATLADAPGDSAYTDLTGDLLAITVTIVRDDTRAVGQLAYDGEYPLMRLEEVADAS